MSKKVKAIPEGFHTLTPYLTLKHAAKAIQFYKDAFGAQEIEINHSTDGRIMNAVIKIGDSYLMLSDEFPEFGCGVLPPQSLKGTSTMLHLYVEDVDAAFNKAINAGASVKMPVEDMFWGDRYGQLEDPFGHLWSIATHIGDVSPLKMDQSSSDSCCHKSTKCCQ
jgi:PhnB protein